MCARLGPSPKTVCVAFLYRSQPLQCSAAERSAARFSRAGKKSAAEVVVGMGSSLERIKTNTDVREQATGLRLGSADLRAKCVPIALGVVILVFSVRPQIH